MQALSDDELDLALTLAPGVFQRVLRPRHGLLDIQAVQIDFVLSTILDITLGNYERGGQRR